ncbi:hypothetical protein F4804DRAFT_315441 [Jackrogersella minutella]|nr:hypothetical protein F4804DRAFT_315441 [Jackrogersella minutella]
MSEGEQPESSAQGAARQGPTRLFGQLSIDLENPSRHYLHHNNNFPSMPNVSPLPNPQASPLFLPPFAGHPYPYPPGYSPMGFPSYPTAGFHSGYNPPYNPVFNPAYNPWLPPMPTGQGTPFPQPYPTVERDGQTMGRSMSPQGGQPWNQYVSLGPGPYQTPEYEPPTATPGDFASYSPTGQLHEQSLMPVGNQEAQTYYEIPPARVQNEMCPSTIVGHFKKAWNKENNYTEEVYDDVCYTTGVRQTQFGQVAAESLEQQTPICQGILQPKTPLQPKEEPEMQPP